MRPEPKLHQLITMLEPWVCEQVILKNKYMHFEGGQKNSFRKMNLADLISTRRLGDIVRVRNCVIYYFMTRMSGVTCNMLGRYFNRDHSTILHARDNADAMLFIDDPDYKRIWHSLDEHIKISGVQREVDAQAAAIEKAEREAAESAKADAKLSAMAKLQALGLTGDEITAIL